MKITDIKTQVKDQSRASVFVDGKYSFSLSNHQLQSSGLRVGAEISSEQLADFNEASDLGKVEAKVLRFLSVRPRSEWEVDDWFRRKKVDKPLADTIIERLKQWKYLDDQKFAESWVNSRRLLKNTSKRKLRAELLAKRVDESIINQVLEADETDDVEQIKKIIAIKSKQSRYQDQQKLMAYLQRQGFGYSDIKQALEAD